MASSEFKFIAVEIPKIITLDFIKNTKSQIDSITAQDAEILNSILKIDISEVQVDELAEDDLFQIGKDSLKAKKVVCEVLHQAVDDIISPRLNIEGRLGSAPIEKGFTYIEVEKKLYAASGESEYFYTSKRNKSYQQLLALSISGVLNISK